MAGLRCFSLALVFFLIQSANCILVVVRSALGFELGCFQRSRYSKVSSLGLPWPSLQHLHVLCKRRDAAQRSSLDADGPSEVDALCVDWHADPPAALTATHPRHLLPEHASVGVRGSQGSGVDGCAGTHQTFILHLF